MPAAGGNAQRAVERQRSMPRTAGAQRRSLQDRSGLRLSANTNLRQAAHGRGGDPRAATASQQWSTATGGARSFNDWSRHQGQNPNWWKSSGNVTQATNVTEGGRGDPDQRMNYADQWEAFGDSGGHLAMDKDFYAQKQRRFGESGGAGQYNFFQDLF